MWIDMEREEQQRTGATRSAANSPAATLEEDEDATDADGQDATDAGQSVVERLALRAWRLSDRDQSVFLQSLAAPIRAAVLLRISQSMSLADKAGHGLADKGGHAA
eukprot:Tamp_18784.p6 GENE.Tamp_18784~~Tamp_18784.p6  ORF type:complete len:106 (-),score=19.58 Tamp_18784:280-597(-)